MLHKILFMGVALSLASYSVAQETDSTETEETTVDDNLIEQTFQSTRIISAHSVECLRKGVLEFRVEHRFGDFAGSNGGVQDWFGLDNSSDIRLGFEYGVTNHLMVGVGRSKGTGTPYRSLLDGFAKYRILQQKKKGMPISLAITGSMFYTYMKAIPDIYSVAYFPKQAYRFSYSAQLNIARKFGNLVSLALMPTLVHRNYVAANDQNTLFALGGAMRWSLTQRWGIMVEYHQVFQNKGMRTNNFNSLGFAVEWLTFGHNFTIYVTNSRGFGETQFITNTYDNWLKGQFRIGFCIGRKFEFGQ
ncbi:DUF5777 family beta-barrel protein [Fluviicola sp.]|uniref:DUF5777 family beta-barrel protein n=1 Tax=Fluviicola sp. TaxID=1917219 RepID=UPI00281B845B|nr:DUF5777 family beta-barrel protein [Fluviicola sp.]MDR0803421.1 DUF5777 family beta-barrel protein [Fluviicola sp.]